MPNLLIRFLRDSSGAIGEESSLMLAILAVSVALAFGNLHGALASAFNNAADVISRAGVTDAIDY
jgi:Flp pilus assembly pilin Flp